MYKFLPLLLLLISPLLASDVINQRQDSMQDFNKLMRAANQSLKNDEIEDWIHISSLKYFNDPIAKLYDVASQGVPTSFLIDPERRIIAKNLKSNDLEATLNVYLKINESK